MEKQLILLRHAEAVEKLAGETDQSRSLSRKGLNDAHHVGILLNKLELNIDCIYTSPAERAQTTAQYISGPLAIDTSLIFEDDSLYLAPMGVLLKFVNEMPNEYNTVIIVGHNPNLSYFTEYITNHSVTLDTAAFARIRFAFDNWHMVTQGSGELLEVVNI
ncbi:histidine phosphatase family protein [Rapidithrix thailandica]|uniref:Histidine phosphatase family protein n=1 Tax=Rapidithrix thailandica TaxID=413964 RepID=A0AAW9S538_9BACT